MKCPICKKPVAFGDPYMPFCSERCKLIDLGNWLDEKYVISTPLSASEATELAKRDESNSSDHERD
jgi:endogenous inhibitor of DNA gyrase (YacG/DUF329 family)